jgi:hypothetical protein
MTYTVDAGVNAVQVRKASDNTAVSGATSSVSGTTATITVPFTDANSPLNIVVVALALSNTIRESAASVSQTFNIPQFAAPVKASEPVYTTVSAGSYTASMTYTVATGVTAVEVRKASDNTSVSGVTSSISGTTATITVPFTDAVSPLNIVVVALNNPGVGRESAASVSQTFNIPQFAAPVKASEPVYTTVSAGSYTAEMTYTVAAGVTAVEVRKASDNTYVSGVSSTNGTTSIIVVPFTDADSPLIIVVVALGNSAGLESAASVSQTLKSPVGFPSVYTSRMNFSVPNGPNGVAVDGSGKIVVSCYFGNQLKVYNNQGSLQANIGSAGSSNGLFNTPSAIAIDKAGNIVVADSGNDRIQMFTIGGTHIRSFGSDGTGDGQFKYPNGIAVNSENHIIVTDSFKQTIPAIQSELVKIFDNTGTFIRKFGSVGTGNGEFNGVIGVAVDKSDKIYVVDSGNYRVQVFDKYGNYISQKTFEKIPQVVTVDDTGKIFVALETNVIVIHDSNWNYIDHFGYTGSNEFEFKFITGMAFDASGNLHVSERANNAVKIIGATPQTFTGQLTQPVKTTNTYQVPSGTSEYTISQTFEMEPGVFGIKLSEYDATYTGGWKPLSIVPTSLTYDTSQPTKMLVTIQLKAMPQRRIGVSALSTYTKSTSVISEFYTSGVVNLPLSHVFSFGSSGVADDRFNKPRGIAVAINSGTKYVYVADTNNHRVMIYTINTSTGVATFSQRKGGGDFGYSAGSSQYDFSSPHSVAVNYAQTRWAVADTGNHQIKVFNTPSGSENDLVFGGLGSTNGKFNNPVGIGFDRSGNIIVGDATRIQVFSSSGTFISKWNLPNGMNAGEINYVCGIAVNTVGNVIVSDLYGVQIFDANGTFIKKLSPPPGASFVNPRVAVDNDGVGKILVSNLGTDSNDSNNAKVFSYTSNGVYIATETNYGSGVGGYFRSPAGVAIDDHGYVYVADKDNNQIQVLS